MYKRSVRTEYQTLNLQQNMKSQCVIHTAYCACRVILAVVLLLSGSAKLLSLKSFADEVARYSELYVSNSFVSWNDELAIVVCVIELVFGVMLLFAMLPLLSLSATLAMMTFFLYLTSVNYLFPTALGSVESCGCFGELVHFTAFGSFVKSLAFWLLSLSAIVLYSKEIKQTDKIKC